MEKGVSGECACVQMESRLGAELQRAATKGRDYSWVLLLGGINDLCQGTPASVVWDSIQVSVSVSGG